MEIELDLFIKFNNYYLTLINNFNNFNKKYNIQYIYDLENKKYYYEYKYEIIFEDLYYLYDELNNFINQIINLFNNKKIILKEIINIQNKIKLLNNVNDKIIYFYLLIQDIKELKNNMKIKI